MLETMTRLMPPAVALALVVSAAPAMAIDGEEIYRSKSVPVCLACHNTGAGGAPRINHPADWDDRLGKGADVMVESVLKGRGAMPAYGRRLSEDEARAAIEYMLGTLE